LQALTRWAYLQPLSAKPAYGSWLSWPTPYIQIQRQTLMILDVIWHAPGVQVKKWIHKWQSISAVKLLAVLAIRGTNLHDISDLKRDLISIIRFGHPTAIVTRAAELVQRYQQDGYGVMVTGHSSGGYMAEIIATTLGLNGIGFCAPGPGEHNGEQRPRGFHAINHESDLIGNHNA